MANVQTQTEWENEMSVKILNFVRNEIYLDLRFLGVALSAMPYEAKETLHTMATDGRVLYFSSEQLLRVFPKNAKYLDRLYLHTILHCLFAHLWIGGSRNREIWGIACDIAVEYTIDKIDKPCTRRLLSWERKTLYEELEKEKKGISAAVVYRFLMEMDDERLRRLAQEFYTDDHRYWPRQEEGQAPIEQQAQKNWNQIARQSKLQQESRGKEPKDGEECLVAQMKAVRGRRNYKEFLKKFAVLREEVSIDPDEFDLNYYAYGLRVYRNMPLIEPLESHEVKKIRDFVIVVDTSYSTSGELVERFLRETATVLLQEHTFFQQCRIRVLQCDDRVRFEQEITNLNQLEAFLDQFTIVGGGGTDFRPAFSYVNEKIESGEWKEISGLLYFTDGLGTYPTKCPPYQTAFLYLEDFEEGKVPPWAIRMKLEPEQLAGKEERE